MDVQISQADGVLTARIIEELAGETSEALRTGVQASLVQSKGTAKELVVDLAGCPFVDSAGLGCLVGLKAHSGSRKLAFRVSEASAPVRRVIRSMRLDSVLGLLDD